jgi:putative ABC transport system substrate-binding protein
MRRREFIAGVGAVTAITWPVAPLAQRPAMPVIGYLNIGDSDLKAFQQGLREMGFIEGQNVVVEYRLTEDCGRM